MSALDNIHEKLISEMTSIEIAIWYTSGATTAYDMEKAAAELAAKDARLATCEKIMQDVKKYLDVVIQSQGGVGMEYELGLVEDIDIYFDKLQEAK